MTCHSIPKHCVLFFQYRPIRKRLLLVGVGVSGVESDRAGLVRLSSMIIAAQKDAYL